MDRLKERRSPLMNGTGSSTWTARGARCAHSWARSRPRTTCASSPFPSTPRTRPPCEREPLPLTSRLEVFTRARYRDGRAPQAPAAPASGRVPAASAMLSIVDVFLAPGVPALTPAVAAEVFCDAVAQELLMAGARGGAGVLRRVGVPGGGHHAARCHRSGGAHRPRGPPRLPPVRRPGRRVIQTAVQYLVSAGLRAPDRPAGACAVLPQSADPVRHVHHPCAVGSGAAPAAALSARGGSQSRGA